MEIVCFVLFVRIVFLFDALDLKEGTIRSVARKLGERLDGRSCCGYGRVLTLLSTGAIVHVPVTDHQVEQRIEIDKRIY